ncbi:hypothetical protein VE25_13700 [Devosia geojensis]|uniref:HTH marR-type domain-containing protein n=1 Tax=Devosia geojensis TaxID=443610 RepID=A0A0F5FR61_9HYPH|nr:ROK family protein [Devosia geojensis]KKB11351.1 hypothetical protein VE25_13700 [Devosia geojensis]
MGQDGAIKLSDVARATLASLLRLGETTRKDLAQDIGISFPTVTAALAELGAVGYVREVRREQGARGRATIVYGVNDAAGWVLGVDVGSTQVSFFARELGGAVLDRESVRHKGDPVAAGTLAGGLATDIITRHRRTGPLHAIAIALNQIVPRDFAGADPTPPISLTIVERFAAAAGLDPDIPVLVENNVNCAAVAEHQNGRMEGRDDAAYMQIGVGIGLGFFCDGTLIRGGQGASGELAQVPISWTAGIASPRDAIERAFGSSGLIASAQKDWPAGEAAPQSSEELFALGEAGNETASGIMQRHAVALARIAATAATVLDPSILVLGGGLSRNAMFTDMIAREFAGRNQRTTIEVSDKAGDATVEGAAILARDLALRRMLNPHYRPLLTRPTVWSA